MRTTLLTGVNGLSGYIRKTDDIYFMYITIEGTKIKDEQLVFKRKKDALKMFDEFNAKLQGVKQ